MSVFLFVDFEATSLNIAQSKIIQWGTVAHWAGGALREDSFQSYVYTSETIEHVVLKLTGIKPEKVKNAPKFRVVFARFLLWLKGIKDQTGDAPINMVAYNGFSFDFPLLVNHLVQHNVGLDWLKFFHWNSLFDPLIWIRDNFDALKVVASNNGNPSFKQGDVYQALFQRKMVNAHTALADCEGLKQICLSEDFDSCLIMKGLMLSKQQKLKGESGVWCRTLEDFFANGAQTCRTSTKFSRKRKLNPSCGSTAQTSKPKKQKGNARRKKTPGLAQKGTAGNLSRSLY